MLIVVVGIAPWLTGGIGNSIRSEFTSLYWQATLWSALGRLSFARLLEQHFKLRGRGCAKE